MAGHTDQDGIDLGTPGVVKYADHESTYLGFLFLLKWSSIAIIAVLCLMAFFLL
jgi:hypothetical protein